MNFLKIFTYGTLIINAFATSLAIFNNQTKLTNNEDFFEEKMLALIDNSINNHEKQLPELLDSKDDFLGIVEGSFEDSLRMISHSDSQRTENLLDQEIRLTEIKIAQMFENIACDQTDTYHNLFVPYKKYFKINNAPMIEFFKNKIIFKLNKIIEKELENKFRSEFKIDLRPGNFIFNNKSNSYIFSVVINFLKENKVIRTWNQDFTWKSKWQPAKHNAKEARKIIRIAKQLILKLDQTFFAHASDFVTDWNLFYYLKGKLENISLDLTIKPRSELKDLVSKLNAFEVDIYFNDHHAFDAKLAENFSSLIFSNDKINATEIEATIQDKIEATKKDLDLKIKHLFQIMKLKYHNLWSIHDTIGEVTNCAQNLFSHLYGTEFSKYISITSNLDPKTPLRKLIIKRSAHVQKFNFTWIFTSPNTVIKYENNNFKALEINNAIKNFKRSRHSLTKEMNANDNIKTNADLLEFLQEKVKNLDYSLIVEAVSQAFLKNQTKWETIKFSQHPNLQASVKEYDFGFMLQEREFNSNHYKNQWRGMIMYRCHCWKNSESWEWESDENLEPQLDFLLNSKPAHTVIIKNDDNLKENDEENNQKKYENKNKKVDPYINQMAVDVINDYSFYL